MQALRASDHVAVVGAIDPDVTTAGMVTTGWIDAGLYNSFLAAVMAGTLGSNATIDAKIEQASDGAGTGAKDVTGKAIGQLTQAGDDASDSQALINLAPDDLDLENGFTHFRLSLTVGTATSDVGALVLALEPRYGPADTNDAATVAEIV